jgi:hypothetical protein
MTEEQKLTTADIAGRGGPAAVDDGKEPTTRDGEVTEPLFSSSDADRYRDQWTNVQSEFVDQPREAVEQADRLVADLMQSLAAQFSDTRTGLESQWNDNDDVSTEDLRVAMTRYRSFFERLLSA